MTWGKYDNFEAFLASYAGARKATREAEEANVPLHQRRERRRMSSRDVVEVEASITALMPDDEEGARHQHLFVKLVAIDQSDPDVDADLQRCLRESAEVFVAIRYGDRQGLPERVPGLTVGTALHLRGEWIPEERAYAHGGERKSVLHFTHDPIGFVCTATGCYS
jgi:endonuclease G